MFGLKKDKAEPKSSAASRLGEAVNEYIAQAIADSSKELNVVLQELASAGIVQAAQQSIVQRIAVGRGQKEVAGANHFGGRYEVPVKFDASRSVETR